jgi:hypothetical protein
MLEIDISCLVGWIGVPCPGVLRLQVYLHIRSWELENEIFLISHACKLPLSNVCQVYAATSSVVLLRWFWTVSLLVVLPQQLYLRAVGTAKVLPEAEFITCRTCGRRGMRSAASPSNEAASPAHHGCCDWLAPMPERHSARMMR